MDKNLEQARDLVETGIKYAKDESWKEKKLVPTLKKLKDRIQKKSSISEINAADTNVSSNSSASVGSGKRKASAEVNDGQKKRKKGR